MGYYVDIDANGVVGGRYGAPQYAGQPYLEDDAPGLIAARLADAKVAKRAAADLEYARRCAAGVVWNGKAYQLDVASWVMISSLAANAALCIAGAPGVSWDLGDPGYLATDNTYTPFAMPQDFLPFATAAKQRIMALREHYRGLKDQIIAAADQTALDAIDLSAGW